MIQHCSHLPDVRSRIAIVFMGYEPTDDRIEIPSFGQDLTDQAVAWCVQKVGFAGGSMKRDIVLIEMSPDNLVR